MIATACEPGLDPAQVDAILARYPREEPSLLPALQDLQRQVGYLPADAIERVAEALGVPLARVFSLATFYRAFSLVPQGRTVIRVCTGTACHLRGAGRIVDDLARELGVRPGEATADLAYGVKTVNCVGACAMAPVVLVGEAVHGHADSSPVGALLGKEGSRAAR